MGRNMRGRWCSYSNSVTSLVVYQGTCSDASLRARAVRGLPQAMGYGCAGRGGRPLVSVGMGGVAGGAPSDTGVRSTNAVAPNVLDRTFTAASANRKWVADFTYLWTAEGWLYVAAVVDLFSRRVVGWSMQATMTTQLVTDALVMAIWRRGKPEAVLHHSDRGSQGEFNRSTQHWVVRRIVGTCLGLRLVSSNQASSAVWC